MMVLASFGKSLLSIDTRSHFSVQLLPICYLIWELLSRQHWFNVTVVKTQYLWKGNIINQTECSSANIWAKLPIKFFCFRNLIFRMTIGQFKVLKKVWCNSLILDQITATTLQNWNSGCNQLCTDWLLLLQNSTNNSVLKEIKDYFQSKEISLLLKK